MGVASKDKRDVYYCRAKAQGYRARSAFKLLDVDAHFGILKRARRAVDLCAAPGSWSQVLRRHSSASVVAVDIQGIEPIEGVTIIQEDITAVGCAERIRGLLGGDADLIVCDGAPDVTGFYSLDEQLQRDLLKAALGLAVRVSAPGSTFVGKCFRGEYSGYIIRHFAKFYRKVTVVKPRASRSVSYECFIVAQDRITTGEDPAVLDLSGVPGPFEVLPCGDGPDPDLENDDVPETLRAIANPVDPPYAEALSARRK